MNGINQWKGFINSGVSSFNWRQTIYFLLVVVKQSWTTITFGQSSNSVFAASCAGQHFSPRARYQGSIVLWENDFVLFLFKSLFKSRNRAATFPVFYIFLLLCFDNYWTLGRSHERGTQANGRQASWERPKKKNEVVREVSFHQRHWVKQTLKIGRILQFH